MIKLSYIIPVYNNELYLERCVNSCIAQGLKETEYEILICDDGSTDGSLKIANRLKAEHGYIQVFSQNNSGAGAARNIGLRNARGQYVIFVDSDDYLFPNSLNSPISLCLKHQLDVCRYVLLNKLISVGKSWHSPNPLLPNLIYDGYELISNPNVHFDTVCSALYKLDFLKTNSIFFSQLTSSEDVEFTLQVYLHAKRVMYDNTQVYIYEIKDDTRGHPTDTKDIINFIKDDLFIASTIYSVASISTYSERVSKYLKLRANSMTTSTILSLLRSRKKINKTTASAIINYAKSKGVYPIKGKTLSWKTTVLAHLLFNRQKLLMRLFDTKNRD